MANFFQNLLKGITRPIRDVAEMENLYQTALNVKRTPETTKSGFSQLKKYQPKYTDLNEAQQLVSNPFLQGTKDIASVGAYLTPVGQGIKGLATTGAVGGGLGGFGGSQQGEELSGALGGAATGGALGALLGIGQKAISGLKPTIQKTQGKVEESLLTGITPKKLDMTPKQVSQAKRTYINTYKELKNSQIGFGKVELANAKNDVISALSGEVDKLGGIPIDGAKQTILNNATQKVDLGLLSKIANKKAGGKAVKDILQAVDSLGDSPTVGELRNIYQSLDDVINYKSTGVVKTTGAVNVDRELKSLRNIIRSQLPKKADTALGKLSDAIKVGDQLKDVVSKQPKLSVAGTSIPIPQGVVNTTEKGLTGLVGGIEKLTPQSGVGVEALGNILKGLVTIKPSQDNQRLQQELSPVEQSQEQGLDFVSALGMAQQIFPNASESELLSLAGELQKQYGGGADNQKLTEKQAMFNSAGQMADKALQLLDSGTAQTGKLASAGSSIGRFLGTQSDTQTAYYSALDAARGSAISALSGANVPPSEYERIRGLIPEPTDEKNIAAQKLRSFKEAMNIYASGSRNVGIVTQ
jgi:hypothetical protein